MRHIDISVSCGRPEEVAPPPGMTYRSMFSAGASDNTSGTAAPGMDDALELANASSDPAQSVPGLDAAANAAFADTSAVPISLSDSMIGRSDEVEGFENNLLGKPKLLASRSADPAPSTKGMCSDAVVG